MQTSSLWSKATGRSLRSAAGVRYLDRWHRTGRPERLAQRAQSQVRIRYFVGLDMVDPFATRPRPCDGAVLDSDLKCQFFQWDYRADGNGVVPQAVVGRGFLLAIDGPQGLAGHPDATSRESERSTRTPGHTRYQMPALGVKKPYAGFTRGSVELFSQMIRPGQRFRLLGLDGVADEEANLVEVYPHAGWRALAGHAPLPNKAALAGRKARHALLAAQGVQFPDSGLPTHDQLDAAMAAWIAYRFAIGQATKEGLAPTLDPEHSLLREGYIVQPTPVVASLRLRPDRTGEV